MFGSEPVSFTDLSQDMSAVCACLPRDICNRIMLSYYKDAVARHKIAVSKIVHTAKHDRQIHTCVLEAAFCLPGSTLILEEFADYRNTGTRPSKAKHAMLLKVLYYGYIRQRVDQEEFSLSGHWITRQVLRHWMALCKWKLNTLAVVLVSWLCGRFTWSELRLFFIWCFWDLSEYNRLCYQ